MNYIREKVRTELRAVIVVELNRLGIDPKDSTRVRMHALEIWQALLRSGKMPRVLTFEQMEDGMMRAAMRTEFSEIFGWHR